MELIDSAVVRGLIGNLGDCPIRLLKQESEARSSLNFPSSCLYRSVSLPFKVRCNKIAAAGIINELEWARREELISYL